MTPADDTRAEKPTEIPTVKLPCLYCGKLRELREDSYEARGIFNVFCPTEECEDKYAARL